MFLHRLSLRSEPVRSALGAFLGIAACAIFLHAVNTGNHWILAPLASTTVILYIQPQSPVAQPWPVLGSYLISCLLGFVCAQWIAPVQLALAVSIAASIWLMVRFQCIHPPGASMALLLVLDGPHSGAGVVQVVAQVILNVGVCLGATMAVSRWILRRPYPYPAHNPGPGLHLTDDRTPLQRVGLTHEDLQSALTTLDTFVDVQESQLVEIYNVAVDHAFGRHVGLTCGDIMSRDVLTVHFDTALDAAWEKLRRHKIKSMPVVDGFGGILGIVATADFLRMIDAQSVSHAGRRLQRFLRRTTGSTSDKPEVVGQIMCAKVVVAGPDTEVAELVARVAEHGIVHIPVVDSHRKVIGIVTQTDLLAALYKRIAMAQARTPAFASDATAA